MYENFELKKAGSGIIQGYSWPLENPDKVVCIIHGIGEYGGRFDRVATEMNKAGLAVLSMDLRGHGNSVEKKGHCAPRREVLQDVTDLLEKAKELYPEKPIVLYGHSMGGNITLDYRNRGSANDAPVGYLISAPWVRLVRPIPGILYRIVKVLSKAAPSMTLGSAVDESTLGHPDKVKPYAANPMVHNKISLLCAVDGFETGKGLEDGSLENNGRAAEIPTLIMHGTADAICDIEGSRTVFRRLSAKGEKVEMKEWNGLFHEIHNGNRESTGDEVIAEMIRWIQAL